MLLPYLVRFYPYFFHLLLLGAFVSLLLNAITIRIANHYALHDIPGDRSSHAAPTPRLGGIGLAVAPLLILLGESCGEKIFRSLVPLDYRMDHGYIEQNRALLLGALLFLGIGLYDDLKTLAPKIKLAGQIAAAVAAVLLLALQGEPHQLLLDARDSPARIAFGALWIVGVVNMLNFMDGLNGMAGLFSCIVLIFGALIYTDNPLLILVLLGSIIGFLFFNLRPRAKIFMGDGGSHFLGFLLGMLSLQYMKSIYNSGPSLIVYLILLMPFLYDVTFTLIKRAAAGATLWHAHREHLYQRLLRCGWSHLAVLALCAPTYIICGMFAANCAWAHSAGARFLLLLASLALMCVYTLFVFWIERRKKLRENLVQGAMA